MRKIIIGGVLAIAGCVSAPTNLDRLRMECAYAPLAQIGSSFIPIPGASGVINMTISAVCANPELVANSEAAIAIAIQTILQRKSGG